MERASGYEGADYYRARDEPVTRREAAFFDRMLEHRLAGMPLQYALGVWSFRSLELLVDARVLIPRPETEVVVDHALAELDSFASAHSPGTAPVRSPGPPSVQVPGPGSGPGCGPMIAVDLGTGSGAIALSLAVERKRLEVWATDRSPAALAVARANLVGLGLDGARVRMVEGAWYAALPTELEGSLALIVSNPPYVAAADELPDEVCRWEPADALISGPTGLEAFAVIVAGAPRWLRPGGALVVEVAPHQAQAVAAAMAASGLAGGEIKRDLTGRDRVVIGRRPSDSA